MTGENAYNLVQCESNPFRPTHPDSVAAIGTLLARRLDNRWPPAFYFPDEDFSAASSLPNTCFANHAYSRFILSS